MSENHSIRIPLMDDIALTRTRQPLHVQVQEIGDSIFLQIDDTLLNIDDLAKYRKWYIANMKVMYYANIIICCFLLFLSFFSKSTLLIVSCCCSFLSSWGFFYSLRLISAVYMKLVTVCVIGSFAACILNVIGTIASDGGMITTFILLVTFIYYIVLSYIMNCVTRIQTILRIVPHHCSYSLLD